MPHADQSNPVDSPRFRAVDDWENQSEARTALKARPAHIAIVVRGTPRSVLFKCPCGCQETVCINVDPQAGKAWRLLRKDETASLLPSVRRTSGCMSHFVLWRNDVWWCTRDADEDWFEGATIAMIEQWLVDRKQRRKER